MVLLCRDHAPGAAGIRDLDLDLSLWQPLVEGRAFVPWLVKDPGEQARLGNLSAETLGAASGQLHAAPAQGGGH